MKHTWTRWINNPPPPELDVVGSWDDPPESEGAMHSAGKSCKRGGCCFWSKHGTLTPPIWWRAAGEVSASE